MIIKNLKSQFNTPEAFSVFSDCMYKPTWGKFSKCASEYINCKTVSIFGYLDRNNIVALIVIDKRQNQMAEIKGISVHPAYRNSGIGRKLIQYVCDQLVVKNLYAETDDDAVDFYKHCGFQTTAFLKSGVKESYRRYKCVLSID